MNQHAFAPTKRWKVVELPKLGSLPELAGYLRQLVSQLAAMILLRDGCALAQEKPCHNPRTNALGELL